MQTSLIPEKQQSFKQPRPSWPLFKQMQNIIRQRTKRGNAFWIWEIKYFIQYLWRVNSWQLKVKFHKSNRFLSEMYSSLFNFNWNWLQLVNARFGLYRLTIGSKETEESQETNIINPTLEGKLIEYFWINIKQWGVKTQEE